MLQLSFAGLLATLLVGAPVWYKLRRDRLYRNFHVVEDGVLYRSGQLDLDGLKQLAARHGIRSIICLREGDAAEDRAEAEWARAAGLNFVRIPPRPWYSPDGSVPAEKGLETLRAVLGDPANHPVLIHCFAGIHRTGAHVAIYRMDRGWPNAGAMNEMRSLGYTTLDGDEDVYGYLARYRPGRAARPPAVVPARAVSRTIP
jgi:uncharacterized protein (TIGR01244 family)